jgi:hypothetical protein
MALQRSGDRGRPWTPVQRSGVRHRDDEAPALGQEQSSAELQPTRLLLVRSGRLTLRRIRSHPYVYGTLDQEEWAEYSDHAPIIATFEADSPGSEG